MAAMTKIVLVGVGAVACASAAAFTFSLQASAPVPTGSIQVVAGSTESPVPSVAIGTTGSQAPQQSAVASGDLPLSDIVYFGAAWPSLELKGANAAFVLGGGYQNARVVRDVLDGSFVAGIVEKADSSGDVTDVILSFSGTQNGTIDNVTDDGLFLGTGDAQTRQAETIFDQIMTDPRFANAHVHVSGHSMGGAMGEWLWGYSMKKYGAEVTRRRVFAKVFAAPPWGNGPELHFGLSEDQFGDGVQNYYAQNDVVQSLGIVKPGVQHALKAFEPFEFGGEPANAAGNFALTEGHNPIAVVMGIGLPSWLSETQRTDILKFLGQMGTTPVGTFNPFDTYYPSYGANGSVAELITGDAVGDALLGSDSGDTIMGGGGADIITGGKGADTFVYRTGDSTPEATDVITDFNSSEGDKIDLRQIDAIASTAGIERFRFIGQGTPTASGDLGFVVSGSDVLVIAHVGGGKPDLVIRLAGRLAVQASDFLL